MRDGLFYNSIEVQIRADGSEGLYTDTYDIESAALAKLYTILAAAAVSDCVYHAGYVLRSDGMILGESKVFDRRAVSNE